MMVYVGQTRSRKLIADLTARGFGEMAARGEMPPRRRPWAFDNGAYGDWKAGTLFDAEAFRADVATIAALAPAEAPDFLVVPDLVAEGMASLQASMRWLPELRARVACPLYLAVQDGMPPSAVAAVIAQFDGLFVGGTLPWKLATGGTWVELGHSLARPVHVGRVGTAKRVTWAIGIGADSIDSTLPLWSKENLRSFRCRAPRAVASGRPPGLMAASDRHAKPEAVR